MSYSKDLNEFEMALRAHIHSNFLKSLPPHFLKLRVSEFIQLASLHDDNNENNDLLQSVGGTPKTATRRSVRQGTLSALSSITKSVKRSLYALTSSTPSKPSKAQLNSNTILAAPHTTSSTAKLSSSNASHSKLQRNSSPSRRAAAAISNTTSQTPKIIKSSQPRHTPRQTPRSQTINHVSSPGTSTGIVQFHLQDGKTVDVDFSRSPKSTLQDAKLLGSDAIGEVKAQIETYANQVMQYMKFFKKFKPS